MVFTSSVSQALIWLKTLCTLGHVQRGSMDEQPVQILDPLQQIYPYWLSLVDYLKIKAFVELTLTENVRLGIQQVIF